MKKKKKEQKRATLPMLYIVSALQPHDGATFPVTRGKGTCIETVRTIRIPVIAYRLPLNKNGLSSGEQNIIKAPWNDQIMLAEASRSLSLARSRPYIRDHSVKAAPGSAAQNRIDDE